jgi:hypothetical protein
MPKLLELLLTPLRILKDCSTDEYGVSYDTVNAAATLAFLVGIGLAVASFVTGKAFDLQTYAVGAGLLLGATCGAQRFKPPAIPPGSQKGLPCDTSQSSPPPAASPDAAVSSSPDTPNTASRP